MRVPWEEGQYIAYSNYSPAVCVRVVKVRECGGDHPVPTPGIRISNSSSISSAWCPVVCALGNV